MSFSQRNIENGRVNSKGKTMDGLYDGHECSLWVTQLLVFILPVQLSCPGVFHGPDWNSSKKHISG